MCINIGPWLVSEDKLLRDLVNTHGTNKWNQLATMLSDRTGKQLRERWHNHLNPKIKKGEWSTEDDTLIVTMQSMLGNQWAKVNLISPQFNIIISVHFF